MDLPSPLTLHWWKRVACRSEPGFNILCYQVSSVTTSIPTPSTPLHSTHSILVHLHTSINLTYSSDFLDTVIHPYHHATHIFHCSFMYILNCIIYTPLAIIVSHSIFFLTDHLHHIYIIFFILPRRNSSTKYLLLYKKKSNCSIFILILLVFNCYTPWIYIDYIYIYSYSRL